MGAKLRTFDGQTEGVLQWMEHLEAVGDCREWSPTQRFAEARASLAGNAQMWWTATKHRNSPWTWELFCDSIIAHYARESSDELIERAHAIKQNGKSVPAYFMELCTTFHRLSEFPDSEKKRIFERNLDPLIQQPVRLCGVKTLDDSYREACRVETILASTTNVQEERIRLLESELQRLRSGSREGQTREGRPSQGRPQDSSYPRHFNSTGRAQSLAEKRCLHCGAYDHAPSRCPKDLDRRP